MKKAKIVIVTLSVAKGLALYFDNILLKFNALHCIQALRYAQGDNDDLCFRLKITAEPRGFYTDQKKRYF